MTGSPLVDHYRRELAGTDPLVREVAARQLGRLLRASSAPRTHRAAEQCAGLSARIETAVGPLCPRPDGALEGACPWHTSRSGRCLVVFADGHTWWCRHCRRGGDAAAWVAAYEGCSYAEARRRLGLSLRGERRIRHRPTIVVTVAGGAES